MNEIKVVDIRGVKIGEGMPKVIVPIVGQNKEEILAAAKAFEGKPVEVVEWRADWFAGLYDAVQVEDVLKDLTKILNGIPLLFTVRTAKEGGAKELAPEVYADINLRTAATGMIDMLDMELFTGEALVKKVVDGCHAYGVKVVMSSHEFEHTPDKIEMIHRLCKMQDMGADIAKIAVMPTCRMDVFELLEATVIMKEKYAEIPLVTMSMTGTGVASRLIGEMTGSALTFGMIGKASAPGQIPAEQLKSILELLHESFR